MRGTGYLCTWKELPAREQRDRPISSQLQSGSAVNREGGLAGSRPPLVTFAPTWSLLPTAIQSVCFIDFLSWNALIICIPLEKNRGND